VSISPELARRPILYVAKAHENRAVLRRDGRFIFLGLMDDANLNRLANEILPL